MISIKKRSTATQEEVFTRDDIKRILLHLPLHGKALILLLVGTGMRVGEAIQLRLSDID